LSQATLALLSHYMPWKSRWRTTWGRVQDALAWRAFAWHKRRFQHRVEHEFVGCWDNFDVVYVHGDVILASKVARYRPTILFLPGPVTADYALLLRAVHAVCSHDDALVRVRAFLGEHVTELPLGLDIQGFTPGTSAVRSTLGWADHHWVVGYVGRLTHLKGVDLLAAAFRELAQHAPDARLLLIGCGEEERYIRTVLAQEFDHSLVHIEPGVNHDQLPAWYRAMDLMVMPSRYETNSNALLEAMACGIPFLASDVGGNRKLSETGAGWLFESEAIPALSQCLRRLIEDRAGLKARGEVSLRAARNHPSWAASAERLEAIITSRLGVQA
jgi:glycosyltransferase involved in cell wall biosynthesis